MIPFTVTFCWRPTCGGMMVSYKQRRPRQFVCTLCRAVEDEPVPPPPLRKSHERYRRDGTTPFPKAKKRTRHERDVWQGDMPPRKGQRSRQSASLVAYPHPSDVPTKHFLPEWLTFWMRGYWQERWAETLSPLSLYGQYGQNLDQNQRPICPVCGDTMGSQLAHGFRSLMCPACRQKTRRLYKEMREADYI